MYKKIKIHTFQEINELHHAINSGLRSMNDNFHIFRYEDCSDETKTKFSGYRNNFYQITYLFASDFKVSINHSDILLSEEKDILILTSPSHIISFDERKKWKGFVLLFKSDFLNFGAENPAIFRAYPYFKPNFNLFPSLNKTENILLSDLFEKMLAEYDSFQLDSLNIIRAYLNVVLMTINRIINNMNSQPIAGNSTRNGSIVESYFELAEKYFHEKKSIQDYADLLHITPKHLSDITKLETGKTAHQILDEFRLLEAKNLLWQTNLSIAEIAFRLNFEEPSYFARFFKKFTGKTPADFRSTR